MKTSKIIGIPGWRTPDGNSFGAGINHLAFISHFGNARIIMPWEEKVEVDLLYLPGGADLSPTEYGEVPEFNTTNPDAFKEFFYRNRLKYYVEDTPIFGVCLGMQMLGIYFGSKLTQHLNFHDNSEDRWETAHTVYNVKDKNDEFEVNSHHHQCIRKSQLAKDLIPLYKAEYEEIDADGKDYIVECFKHKTLPIAGIQWHVEELYDRASIELFYDLLHGVSDK